MGNRGVPSLDSLKYGNRIEGKRTARISRRKIMSLRRFLGLLQRERQVHGSSFTRQFPPERKTGLETGGRLDVMGAR